MSNIKHVVFHAGCIKTWSTANEVSKDDEGYFGNTIQQLFENVENNVTYKVEELMTDNPSIVFAAKVDGQLQGFSLFLPTYLAHGFVPFEKFSELKELTGARLFGEITFRQRIQGTANYFVFLKKKVNCYYGKTPKLKSICGISVDTLCNLYEVQDREGHWVPCGKRMEIE